jgi:hypothetical protein
LSGVNIASKPTFGNAAADMRFPFDKLTDARHLCGMLAQTAG